MDKSQLRRTLLAQRKATPKEQRARENAGITRAVLARSEYARCRTLFVYCSTPEEIDTRAIITDALRRGKRVCLPKCLPGHRMELRQIALFDDLTEQTYGIDEPGAHCPVVPPEAVELCLVPALACDARGARLGYGGGFYDRFLRGAPAYRMVLCAHSRLLPEIPAEAHDVFCDCVVTEQGVLLVHEK